MFDINLNTGGKIFLSVFFFLYISSIFETYK